MSGESIVWETCPYCGTQVQNAILQFHAENTCPDAENNASQTRRAADTQDGGDAGAGNTGNRSRENTVCGLADQRNFLQLHLEDADAWAREMQGCVKHPTNRARIENFRYELGKLLRRAGTLARHDREPVNAVGERDD